jgi:hypothetical protein
MKDCNISISVVQIHCRQNVELRDNFEIPNKRIYIYNSDLAYITLVLFNLG